MEVYIEAIKPMRKVPFGVSDLGDDGARLAIA
jgi:hypothetical protein